jgi:hypothetical protein
VRLKSELFVSEVDVMILEERMIKVKVIIIVIILKLIEILVLNIRWTEMNKVNIILIGCLELRIPMERRQ